MSIVFGTVIAVSLQDLSPALVGVKPPVVAAAALFLAFHVPLAVALGVAFAAGLFVDALAGVPALCSTSLLPLLTLGVHFICVRNGERPSATVGAGVTLVAAAVGETWLALCGFADMDTGMLVRCSAAAALAIPVGAATFALLPPLGRLAGLEEAR